MTPWRYFEPVFFSRLTGILKVAPKRWKPLHIKKARHLPSILAEDDGPFF